jgi:hypothetical protein
MMATAVTSTVGNVLSSNPVDLVMWWIWWWLKLVWAEGAWNFVSRFTAWEILKDTLKNSLDDDEASIGWAVSIKKEEFAKSSWVIGTTLAWADLAITWTYAAWVYATRKTLWVVDSWVSAIWNGIKGVVSYFW